MVGKNLLARNEHGWILLLLYHLLYYYTTPSRIRITFTWTAVAKKTRIYSHIRAHKHRVIAMSTFAYNVVRTIARPKQTTIVIRLIRTASMYSVRSSLLLFVVAVVVCVLFGSGDCQSQEMCVDRPWSPLPNKRLSRIVDAPLGSDIMFLCNYCGETSGDEARFWYTAERSGRTTRGPELS